MLIVSDEKRTRPFLADPDSGAQICRTFDARGGCRDQGDNRRSPLSLFQSLGSGIPIRAASVSSPRPGKKLPPLGARQPARAAAFRAGRPGSSQVWPGGSRPAAARTAGEAWGSSPGGGLGSYGGGHLVFPEAFRKDVFRLLCGIGLLVFISGITFGTPPHV